MHLFIDSVNISRELLKARNDAQYFHTENERQSLIYGRQSRMSIVVKSINSDIIWQLQGRLLEVTLESAQQAECVLFLKRGEGCEREQGMWETSYS